jgi:cytidylate kinase
MSIITISRGSYSRGKEVAEKLALALGYECLSRDILLEASERYNIPEIKLIRAIHDAPSILERFTYTKEQYVAYVRAALLRHVQKDNVVYHGLAGHFLLQGIPHVLKVRILADLEDRVQEEMKRENLSADEARRLLQKDDEERRRWSLKLYGLDTADPSLYDLVIHIKSITVKDAVDMIKCALQGPCFQATPEAQKLVDELSLAAQIESALVQEFPGTKVEAQGGEVFIYVKRAIGDDEDLMARIKRLAANVAGLETQVNLRMLPK